MSAQTQAFVPAHTVRNWPANQPPPLYGAYGQPLHPSHAPPPPQAAQPGYPLPSPQSGPYNTSGASYGPPSHGTYDDRGRDGASANKRKFPEPHTPTLPPPTSHSPAHRGSGSGPEYTYPDPTNLTPATVSPASSSASYHGGPQPPAPQPYYTNQPPPPSRSSPQSNPYYDPNRSSSSPHTGAAPPPPPPAAGAPATSAGAAAAPYPAYGGTTSLQPIPHRTDGRTPPPTAAAQSGGAGRAGMRINDLVDSSRSSADNDMLNQLNRRL